MINAIIAITASSLFIILWIYYLKKFWRFRNKKFETLDRFDRAEILDYIERHHYRKTPENFLKSLKIQLIVMIILLILEIGIWISLLLYFLL